VRLLRCFNETRSRHFAARPRFVVRSTARAVAMRPTSEAVSDSDAPGSKRTRVVVDPNVGAGPEKTSATTPCISVLMPCRNAMPWLPDCVASVLAQEGLESDGGLELIVVDDSSTDGSREWLRSLAAALEEEPPRGRSACSVPEKTESSDARDAPEEAFETETKTETDETPFTDTVRLDVWEKEKFDPLSIDEVVERRTPGNSLTLRTVTAFGPSGQGLALNSAFRVARAGLIGEMESDDVRPPDCFFELRKALLANEEWHCVTSQVKLIGWSRPGMARWIDWQNALDDPEKMRRGRFLEIPALRGSGLFRRDALEGLMDDFAFERNPYRDLWMVDGRVQDCAHASDPDYRRKDRRKLRPAGWWPVDADFWQRFFAARFVAGKVASELYFWRQYPAQSTRTHDRCSLARLRKCKAHFLVAKGGPCEGKAVQVWGTGDTLKSWVADLREALVARLAHEENAHSSSGDGASDSEADAARRSAIAAEMIRAIEYKPGAPISAATLREEDARSTDSYAKRATETGRFAIGASRPKRLFAFGTEKARSKIARTFPGFHHESDECWFVA